MDDEKMLARNIQLILDRKVIFERDKLAKYAKVNYSQEILSDKLLKLYEEIRGN